MEDILMSINRIKYNELVYGMIYKKSTDSTFSNVGIPDLIITRQYFTKVLS